MDLLCSNKTFQILSQTPVFIKCSKVRGESIIPTTKTQFALSNWTVIQNNAAKFKQKSLENKEVALMIHFCDLIY